MAEYQKRVGRPINPNPKQPVSIRLSPEVLEAFKATGGWQTRIDSVLLQYVANNMPGSGLG